MIRAVLFDLDDTLHHREAAFDRWARDFARHTLRLEDESERQALLAEMSALDANGYGSKAAVFAMLHARYPTLPGDARSSVEAFYDDFLTYLTLDAEAHGLLEELERRRIRFGIVTNGGPRQWDKLRVLQLDRRTSCLFVSDTFGARKPHPAIFRAAAEALGVPPDQVLFVGDHPENDVAGAVRVGMKTAWLPRGKPWPAELRAVRPNHVLNSLDDLHPILFPSPEAP